MFFRESSFSAALPTRQNDGSIQHTHRHLLEQNMVDSHPIHITYGMFQPFDAILYRIRFCSTGVQQPDQSYMCSIVFPLVVNTLTKAHSFVRAESLASNNKASIAVPMVQLLPCGGEARAKKSKKKQRPFPKHIHTMAPPRTTTVPDIQMAALPQPGEGVSAGS